MISDHGVWFIRALEIYPRALQARTPNSAKNDTIMTYAKIVQRNSAATANVGVLWNIFLNETSREYENKIHIPKQNKSVILIR